MVSTTMSGRSSMLALVLCRSMPSFATMLGSARFPIRGNEPGRTQVQIELLEDTLIGVVLRVGLGDQAGAQNDDEGQDGSEEVHGRLGFVGGLLVRAYLAGSASREPALASVELLRIRTLSKTATVWTTTATATKVRRKAFQSARSAAASM